VAGPSTIAIPSLGEPTDRLDSATVSVLTAIGEHLLADERSNRARFERGSFLSRVPSYIRTMLSRAYSEIYLLDNNALALAYLNGDSVMTYRDQAKRDRASILMGTPELVSIELDRVSSLAAIQAGQIMGLL
jgi:hypothetical protein